VRAAVAHAGGEVEQRALADPPPGPAHEPHAAVGEADLDRAACPGRERERAAAVTTAAAEQRGKGPPHAQQ
jgi:hypothetical protein